MHAAEIAKALGGKRSGAGFTALCPAHDDRDPSLSIGNGEDGRLLLRCHAGCAFPDITATLRKLGLLSDDRPRRDWQSPRLKTAQPAPVGSPGKLASILSLAGQFQNSLAARYIRARGGAEPAECDLRYLPSSAKFPWPTMLGIITDLVSGTPMSLHFTMLNMDGTAKAPVDKPKRLLTGHRKAGGVIRLTGDAELTTHLGIAEGIESALAITAAMGASAQWLPVWSAIDAGNLAGLPVIEGVERLTIFADTDRTGTGQKAAQALAARWHAAGREVFIAQPPAAPGTKRDWNDGEAT